MIQFEAYHEILRECHLIFTQVELCNEVERVNLTHLECKLKPCYMAEDFLSSEPRLILMFGDLQSAPVNYTRIVFTDMYVDKYNVTNLDGISSPMRNSKMSLNENSEVVRFDFY